MDEIGQILREAREAKGLTLEEVQAEIRIVPRFLEAMERGDYAALPTPVHVRGFLRNYARFLNLDPAPLLERYETKRLEQPPLPQQIREEMVEPVLADDPAVASNPQPFFDPVNFELNDGRSRDPASLLRLAIIIALIISLGLVANRFVPLLLGQGDGTEELSAGIRSAWEQVVGGNQAEVEPAVDEESGVTSLTGTEEPVQNTSRNNFDESTGAPRPTLLPTRPPLPATMEVIDLRLDISERTWMEVSIDGDVRFSGWATRGDIFEWTAEEEVLLLTGNAYGIIATINETELGRLGGFQEAREEVWRTTQ